MESANSILQFDQEKKDENAIAYLEKTVGFILREILSECASKRPDDPILFIADQFEM